MCIEKLWLDFKDDTVKTVYDDGTESDEFIPMWLDSPCSELDNPCSVGSYVTDNIVFTCQAWSGSSDVAMLMNQENFIVEIIPDIQDLEIQLTSNVTPYTAFCF